MSRIMSKVQRPEKCAFGCPMDGSHRLLKRHFHLLHEGEASNFTFEVTLPQLRRDANYKIQAVAEYNGKEYTEGYQRDCASRP